MSTSWTRVTEAERRPQRVNSGHPAIKTTEEADGKKRRAEERTAVSVSGTEQQIDGDCSRSHPPPPPTTPTRPGRSHNSTSSPERVTRPGLINCELGTTQPLHLGAPRDAEGRRAEGAEWDGWGWRGGGGARWERRSEAIRREGERGEDCRVENERERESL